ncbi:tetratricopeptide repeat protein [Alienimonas chondri]|nr:hypothetical protein [Alienimonas chondri]
MPRLQLHPAGPAALAALCATVLIAGCGESGEEASPPAESGEQTAAAETPGEPKAAPKEPISPIGTFRLLTPRQGRATNFGAITIAEEDGKPVLKGFNPTEQLESLKPEMTLIEASEDAVSFKLTGREEEADIYLQFEGKPTPGVIIGTLHDETGGAITPALLVPLPPGEPNPGPPALADATFEQIVKAIGAASPDITGLEIVAKRNPYAPAFFPLYQAAIASEAQQDKTPKEIRKIIAGYVAFSENWGPWAVADAHRTAGALLISVPTYREIADEQLAAAVAALPDAAPEGTAERWQEQFEALQAEADRREDQLALSQRMAEAMELAETDAEAGLAELRAIRADRPDEPPTLYMLADGLYRYGGDAGRDELAELHEQYPLEAVVTYLLAEKERTAGRKEEARKLYAEATAIPGGPYMIQPLAQRAAPGELKHPREWLNEELEDTGAVAELLAETYRRLAKSIAEESRPADDGDRTVLAELFTGSMCPPCVAADMATAALAETFPQEDLVILQYHLHVPGADPLTNADTVARAAAVDVRGTPTFRLDGETPDFQIGGPVGAATEAYESLVEAVEARRGTPAGATIDVETKADGDRFDAVVTARREGGFAANHRLHVVIAEDEMVYAAPNSIRTHEMLVRAMPTGAAGVGPGEDGVLTYRVDSSVSDLRDELKTYLAAYEREHDGRIFPDKPMQLTRLTAVAWIEDSTSGEVLQTAFSPLGEFDPPAEEDAASPAETPDAAPKAESTKDDPSKKADDAEADAPEADAATDAAAPTGEEEPAENAPAGEGEPEMNEAGAAEETPVTEAPAGESAGGEATSTDGASR